MYITYIYIYIHNIYIYMYICIYIYIYIYIHTQCMRVYLSRYVLARLCVRILFD